MKTLRAAVIGLGVGSTHAQAYPQIPGVELALLCDTNEERLRAVGERLGVAGRTTRWQDVVADGRVDVVSLCTPDHMHYEQAAALIRADKHVFCEKPMVYDPSPDAALQQARSLVELVYEHGVLFGVGNVCRFMPQFAVAAEQARQGKLGELFFVESDYIHDMREVFVRTPWRVDPQRPQSPIYGGGVHPIDLLRWVAGEAVEVFAYGNHKTLPEYHQMDNVLISIKFASGCIGKVWVCLGIQQRPHNQIPFNIYGSQGSIRTDSQHAEVRLYIDGMIPGQNDWATIPITAGESKPVLAELQQFVECIRYGRWPLVNVVQGMRTVAVMAAAQASLDSGQPVTVEAIPYPRQLHMLCADIRLQPMPELPEGYGVRTFQPGDEANWLRICRPEFGTSWDEARLHEQILDKPWFRPEHMFFATYQGQPVGVATAWQEHEAETETGSLHYIAVQPEHRRKHLGLALTVAVLNCLAERGFRNCALSTDDFRWHAIRLYWKVGFRPDQVQDELDRRRWQGVQRRLAAKK